jgi:hypothetical protein
VFINGQNLIVVMGFPHIEEEPDEEDSASADKSLRYKFFHSRICPTVERE